MRAWAAHFVRTVERFRYRANDDLLTVSERAAIMVGRDDEHRWRSAVLEGREPHPTPVRFDELDPWVDLIPIQPRSHVRKR
jgi:hypothetical protein